MTKTNNQYNLTNDIFNTTNVKPFDYKNKAYNNQQYIMQFLNRTQTIFEYKNLPDTIPQKYLELYMQTKGYAVIAKHSDNNLYVFWGNFGGARNAYYMPVEFIVNNPWLNISKTFEIDKDCVLMQNDSLLQGIIPLINRYTTLLTENDLSMLINNINSRIVSLISSADSKAKQSADLYIKKIIDGDLSVIADSQFIDGIKTQPYGTTSNNLTTQLIEFEQYIKASLLNELGIVANYNMKRESINSNEAQLNNQFLIPLIDDMLNNRKKCIENVNKMFGTDISVELKSIWKFNSDTEKNITEDETETETKNSEDESGDNIDT